MAAFGYLVWAIVCAIYRAWLGSIAWSMSAVPWFGLPALSTPMMFALSIMIALCFSGKHNHDERTDIDKNVHAFLVPSLAFGIFWIAMQFV